MVAYNKMVDLFRKESDRSAAILAVSFLDNSLRKLLSAYFVKHRKVTELFEGDRPLATFSSKITIAFALGLLSADTFADLTVLRRIRNHFAHSEEAATFNDRPTREWCAALRMVKQIEQDPRSVDRGIKYEPRERFLLGSGLANLLFDSVLQQIADGTRGRQAPPDSNSRPSGFVAH